MMGPHQPARLVLLLAIGRILSALEVTPGSRCATYCLDSPGGNQFKASDSTTKPTDISCKDVNYSTTDEGIKFRKCLDCLQTSNKVDKDESDLKWYIYNLRYTIGTCLFSEPHAPPKGTIHSPCNVDKACQPLKGPLTGDGVKPVPQNTWDYCTANDGSFMGPNLSPCISCLQATEGEVYLSNFLTALEAGCKQDPQNGQILSLSGTLFSTNAVNITDPSARDDGPKGAGLSPGAIAGIVIGVVMIFVAAAALFTVYWRRQRNPDEWDHACCLGNRPSSPASPMPRRSTKTSQAYHQYYSGNAYSDKPAPPYASSGEYYDHVKVEIRAGRMKSASDAHSQSNGPLNAIPTHERYMPRTVSCATTQVSSGRPPSPPAAVHKPGRTNTPDSFAIQSYLAAAEDSARLAVQPPEPRPRAGERSKKAFALHSLPKLRIPGKCRLPRMLPEALTPGGTRRGHEMHISGPVGRDDARFHDRPAGGRAMGPTKQPPNPRPQQAVYRQDGYIEVPLRSGDSALWG